MIVTGFVYLGYYFLSALISLLPESTGLSSSFTSSLTSMFTVAQGWNWIFPINTLISILILSVGLEGGILLWNFLMWTYNKVRGI